MDLSCKLARWRKDQCPATTPWCWLWIAQQAFKNRQRKGRRLSGAGLRNAEQIAARHQRRDRLRLDRRRRRIAFGLQRAKQFLIEVQVIKSGQVGLFSNQNTQCRDMRMG